MLDPTPLANCSVRQQTEHVSGPLRATAGWGEVVPQLKLPVDGALPSTDFLQFPFLLYPTPHASPETSAKPVSCFNITK